MPTFESHQSPEYTVDRNLEQQIAFAYRKLVERIESLSAEMSDAVVLAVSNEQPYLARMLAPFAEQIKECHGKNVKLVSKMKANNLGN